MTGARAVVFALAAAAAACGARVGDARAQWLVTVATDAPVPQLGDRLLVELLAPDGAAACSGCRRLFGIEGAASWPLSFGIPEPDGSAGLRLRARLFRSDHADAGGGPVGGVPIDVLGALPPTNGEIRNIVVTLSTACAGIPSDLAASLTCDATTGGLVPLVLDDGSGAATPLPGSFPLAQPIPCRAPPPSGTVCVEGGLFVRGNNAVPLAFLDDLPATPERLVHLSPFAIDITETTVAQMRALVGNANPKDPYPNDASQPTCLFTAAPGASEDFPVNCVSRAVAMHACEMQGKRLPTEAEWEFVAADRDRQNRYPWGSDPDACAHAIIGRGRSAIEGGSDISSVCRAQPDGLPPLPWGPRPVMESPDVTTLGVRDLGGNVAEWVSDVATPYDSGSCNAGPNVLEDPHCDTSSDNLSMTRGGYWSVSSYSSAVSNREVVRPEVTRSGNIGFRCARSL